MYTHSTGSKNEVTKIEEQKSETIALDAFVDMIKVEGKR